MKFQFNLNQRVLIILLLSSMSIMASAQNRVLTLDGNSGYVSLPQPIIQTSEFSIEAWFLMAGEGGGPEQQNFIFSQRDDLSGCDHSAVSLAARALPDLPNRSFAVRSDESCYDFAVSPSEQFVEWRHIVGVKDVNTMKLYIDGQLVATTEIQQTGSYSTNISTMEIGRHRVNGENSGFYNGSIDDVAVWDRALSAMEIESRMEFALQGNENGLIAFWNFDDDTATDLTGNENDGVFVGGAITQLCNKPVAATSIWGDLNNDGQINVSDVVVLIDRILNR